MKLYRSFSPGSFFANFIRVTDHSLCQLKVTRLALGGVWVKVNDTWVQVDVVRETDHGMLLSMPTYDGTASVSFWDTHLSVQDLEDYR